MSNANRHLVQKLFNNLFNKGNLAVADEIIAPTMSTAIPLRPTLARDRMARRICISPLTRSSMRMISWQCGTPRRARTRRHYEELRRPAKLSKLGGSHPPHLAWKNR